MTVSTIGHSTRSADELIRVLEAHGIAQLADIRTVPRSRTNPQFNRETLPGTLGRAGIRYRHFPGLGGLRRPVAGSPNTGWRNASFRGYADYMQTPEFESSLNELIGFAYEAPTAIMCAEAVSWRCHRSLVADALLVRGIPVVHLESEARTKPHKLTPFATVRGTVIAYKDAI